MLFRCPKCHGEFDVELDARKGVVYCSHCGAAFRTGKSAQGIAGHAGPVQPRGFDTTEQPAAPMGYAALADAVADEGGSPNDPFSSIASRGVPPVLHSGARRIHRRKKSNAATIMIISIVGALVVIVAALIIILIMNREQPEEPVKKTPRRAAPPGELFPGKGS